MSTFKTNPFWFGKYYATNIAIFGISTIVVLFSNQLFQQISYAWLLCLVPLFLGRLVFILAGSAVLTGAVLHQYWGEVSGLYLLAAPFAAYLGALSGVLLHNTAHANFKPRWSNPIIGEILALQQLSAGFQIFRLVHNIHHANADDPVLDPHPPKGYSFFQFVDASRNLIGNSLKAMYFKTWGETEKTKRDWNIQNSLLIFSRFAKTLFIFSLLGPKFFVLLFLPAYLGTVIFFACFNYFSHREQPDGSVEILNLDSNLAYKFANRILFGVMFHKNHHLKPKLFNPRYMKPLPEKALGQKTA